MFIITIYLCNKVTTAAPRKDAPTLKEVFFQNLVFAIFYFEY